MQRSLIAWLIVLGTAAIALLAVHLFRKFLKKSAPAAHAAGDVLPGPGISLLGRMGELDDALKACLFALVVVPVFVLAGHFIYSFVGREPESLPRTAMSVAVALSLMALYMHRLLHALTQRRLCRLAYHGEVAVGRELEQLAVDGYRAYHEFPADHFTINHVVVGPAGVMAVETAARSAGRNGRGHREAVVVYDGRMLHFPKYSDYETLDQAVRHAEWLSEWLSTTLDEDVYARAIVATPGWAVKRTSAEGISVVNPKQFAKLFKYIRPRPMGAPLMQRILEQIEDRYRQPPPGPEPNGPGTDHESETGPAGIP